MTKAGSLLSSAWDGIAEFFERGVNWISGEGFRTDEQIAKERFKAYMSKVDVVYGDDGVLYVRNENGELEEYNSYLQRKESEGALNPEVELTAGGKTKQTTQENDRIQKAGILASIKGLFLPGMFKVINFVNTVINIEGEGGKITPVNPKTMTEEEYEKKVIELSEKLNMAQGGKLHEEIAEALKDLGYDPNQVVEVNGKNTTLSDSVRMKACHAGEVYKLLVLAGADVGEFSQFYAEMAEKGYIEATTSYVNNATEIVKKYLGKNAQIMIVSSEDEMKRLLNTGQVKGGLIRVYNSKPELGNPGHSFTAYKADGAIRAGDIGARDNNKALLDKAIKYWKDKNQYSAFQYFWYIRY